MKILKIIHGYPPHYNAGSEVYSQSLCEELSQDNEVYIFTREENPYIPDFSIREDIRRKNLVLYFVNMAQDKDGFRHIELDKKFAQLINQIKPDIAHVGHLNHLSTGIVDRLRENGIPIVYTLHDFWLMCPRGQFLQKNFGNTPMRQLCTGQENYSCATNCYSAYFTGQAERKAADIEYWINWVENRMKETKSLIEKVDRFIAPSKYLMNRFINEFKIPESKIQYLDYGFPIKYLTPSNGNKSKDSFCFGYIGTHIPAKGVNLLIEAFGKLKGEASLKIWGRKDGQSTTVLMEAAKDGGKEISFMGEYVNKNLADEVFSKIDGIVVPSIWAENSPLVIHEAQACHIPVITADVGGMAEYVNHKENGLLFQHRNVESLAEQMQWAIENAKEFKKMGKRGYLYTSDGRVPEISEHTKDVVSIYRQVIEAKVKSTLWRITIDTNPEDCNLNCIMCEEHSPFSKYIDELYKETGKRKRRMPVEWLDKIFEQAKILGIREIIPSTMGEPLIYKAIDKIYDLAEGNKIKVNLTTNGTFPRKPVSEWAELIIPNTSDVKISWNGATKQTAEAVMKGIDFDKVKSNVQEFVRYRNQHYQKTGRYCRITFQLTFMQNNMHELSDIIKLAASLNIDRVKGHHLWAHFREIGGLSMKSSEDSIKKWNQYVVEALDSAERNRRPNGDKVILENINPIQAHKKSEVPEEYACPFLGKELWISATGKISPCCAPDKLRDSLGDFGNIQNTTIEEAINSKPYRELVKDYKQRELCKTCNMRKPL